MKEEKIIELNKKIRKYDESNSFILSLQKQLKISKTYFEVNKKKYKRLSDRQYQVAESILND